MAVPNIVYLDTETKNLFDDVGGRGVDIKHWLSDDIVLTSEGILKLAFGIAATYDNEGLRFWSDPAELLGYLLDEKVDHIVHFNGTTFDIPMILAQVDPPKIEGGKAIFSESFQMCYDLIGTKSTDILVKCEEVLGHRISLDSIIQGCFGRSKIMSGADWWKYYTSGDILKQTTAVNYLIGDVLDLYKIHSIGLELGQLAFTDSGGKKNSFKVEFKPDDVPF